MSDRLKPIQEKTKKIEEDIKISQTDEIMTQKIKEDIALDAKAFGKNITDRRLELKELYNEHSADIDNPYKRYQFCTSQEKLGDLLNAERRTVGRWEAGTSIPDLEQAYGLSILLDTRLDYLLGFKELDEKVHELDDYFGLNTAHRITGINKDILTKILFDDKDKSYITLLNAFMHPKNCSFLHGLINNMEVLGAFRKLELTGIKEPLRHYILLAYDNDRAINGLHGSSLETFKNKLYEYLNPDIVALSKRNKTKTIFVRQCIESSIQDRIDFSNYDAFIESLANYCYKILFNKEQYDLHKNQLLEQFSRFVDLYVEGNYEGNPLNEIE